MKARGIIFTIILLILLMNTNTYSIENSNIKISSKEIFQDVQCSSGKIQGNRTNMEDISLIDKIQNISVFGIYDGHGSKTIAEHLKLYTKNITNIILDYQSKNITAKQLKKEIYNNFLKKDYKLFKSSTTGGSTCLILYLLPKKYIYVNLGDSKGVYIRDFSIYFNTLIHRPNFPTEIYRIKNTNFSITENNGIYRIDNTISLSRSFGDFKYKTIDDKYDGINSAISIIPDIFINKYKTKCNYFILATDGFWDYIKDSTIEKIIKTQNDISSIVKGLIIESIKNGSNDNITVILVRKSCVNTR